ncbi:MAG: stage V sporulation protein AD [Clostridia bacterium]|nr:stage V sporulation protein AD [Clostridia bacterium]
MFDKAYITCCAAVGGALEKRGPLGNMFDITAEDSYFGMDSWEQAESEMSRLSVNMLLKKASLAEKDIDVLLGGDLLNQCTATGFAANSLPVPYLGLYNACATAAEALLLGASLVSGGHAEKAVAAVSSHFCSSERQFRFPLEYGSQRPPYSQNTVTGAGAFLLERSGSVRVTRALIGKVTEKGVTDANNMGAAMAPAAAQTLTDFLELTGERMENYDAVVTGDLGREGSALLAKLLESGGVASADALDDCGLIVYGPECRGVNAGGSGCGCSACVMATYFWQKLCKKEIQRMLFVGTGALLSPRTVMQKQVIPCIAHLVELESI